MVDNQEQDGQRDETASAIFNRALTLAAARLEVMNASYDEAADFDRGARAAGSLMRIAVMAEALQRDEAKEQASDDEPQAVETISAEEYAKKKRDIDARLHRELARLEETDGGAA